MQLDPDDVGQLPREQWRKRYICQSISRDDTGDSRTKEQRLLSLALGPIRRGFGQQDVLHAFQTTEPLPKTSLTENRGVKHVYPPSRSSGPDRHYRNTSSGPLNDDEDRVVHVYSTDKDLAKYPGGSVSGSELDEDEQRDRTMREDEEERRARETYYAQAFKQRREAEEGRYNDERSRKMFAQTQDVRDYINSSRGVPRRPEPSDRERKRERER